MIKSGELTILGHTERQRDRQTDRQTTRQPDRLRQRAESKSDSPCLGYGANSEVSRYQVVFLKLTD